MMITRLSPASRSCCDVSCSRQQNARPGSLAALEILVRLAGVLERVFLVHRYLHLADSYDVEQIACDGEQVIPLCRIGIERGAGGKQRAFALQQVDVECLDRSGRIAEAHEHAERLDAVERRRKCCLADAVIDSLAKLSAGDFLHSGGEILLPLEDRVMAAVRVGERGLLPGADRADDSGAKMIGPLAGDQ